MLRHILEILKEDYESDHHIGMASKGICGCYACNVAVTASTGIAGENLLNVPNCYAGALGTDVLSFISLLVIKFPSLISWVFDNNVNHRRTQITRLHASRCHHCIYCHYCNIDFVLFLNVTSYTASLLSCIHVNTTELLNITCTLVASSMILWRLECTSSRISVCKIIM